MRSITLLASFAILLSLPSLIIACEGDCIIGITNAFVGNYSTLVQRVFADLALNISHNILPSQPLSASSKIVEPLLELFESGAYNRTEFAVFPSYFHGKCQVNGVDAVGCPDPDCPVVCGTPGSLAHFYPTLLSIVYNVTSSSLTDYLAPSSSAFGRMERSVMNAARSNARRGGPLRRAEDGGNDLTAKLVEIVRFAQQGLATECGDGLVNCSWEAAMKQYILTFN